MLKNKSLKFKLILSFIIVAVITIIVGVIGWISVQRVNYYVEEIGKDNLPSIRGLNIMYESTVSEMNAVRSYMLTGTNDTIVERLEKSTVTSKERKENGYEMYDMVKKSSEEEKMWGDLKPLWEKYWKDIEDSEKLAKEYYKIKEKKEYEEVFNKIMVQDIQNYYDVRDKLKAIIELNQTLADKNIDDSSKISTIAVLSTILAMLIGAIVSITLGVVLSIAISKPINKIVDELMKGSEQVASASEQLSESSQQLAEGSSEQAASIEETSSTLSETSSMVQQNNENTRQASILASETKKSSEKGNQEMSDMLSAMEDIKKSSAEISKIIKVIDEIAFQTNILSLNAAVEAARAGEAGAGFAVVAEEVRNLAQRSAQAAKDTAVMIETSVERAAAGVGIAKKVAESLGEITEKAEKVNAIMDEINVASQEQSQGIGQINKAVSQMEQVTQNIASNAEESAATSEELNAQAENLKEIVGNLTKIINGKDNFIEVKHERNKSVKGNELKSNHEIKSIRSSTSASKTKSVEPSDVIPLEDDSSDF